MTTADEIRRIVTVTMVAVAAVTLVMLTVYACLPTGTPDRIARSKEIGDGIISALERYHSDRGQYPASLDELVPDYLDEIEMPTAGSKRWEYGLYKDGYRLRFGVGEGLYPGYFTQRPSMDYWQLDC